MSEILITGGTGFIGSLILKDLIFEDSISKVVLITRDVIRAKKKLSEKNIKLSTKIIFIEYNFKENTSLNEKQLKTILSCTKVYHFGASISLSNNKNIIDINYGGTKFILDLFIKNNIQLNKFIFLSTAYAFGKQTNIIPEDWILKMPEKFRNSYEKSKFLCEKLIYNYNKKYDLNYLILRPSIVISKKQNSKKSPQTIFSFGNLIKKYKNLNLYSSKSSVLNFISLETLNKVFVSLEKNKVKNKIINLVGENILVSDLKNIYEEIFDIKINLIENKVGISIDNSINNSMPYLLNPQKDWETNYLRSNNLNEDKLYLKEILEDYFKNE